MQENGKLTNRGRKKLLIHLFETGEMEDFAIRRDLEKNIRNFKGHPNFTNAISKWKDDLEFFNLYLEGKLMKL